MPCRRNAPLGGGPQSAWFAGDNVGYDMTGAFEAGLHPVAYRVKDPIPESVTKYSAISHWSELGPLIDSLSLAALDTHPPDRLSVHVPRP